MIINLLYMAVVSKPDSLAIPRLPFGTIPGVSALLWELHA